MIQTQNIKITLVQPAIFWENQQANIEHYQKLLNDLDTTDLIVFPEMFTTGFSMRATELKESMNGQTVGWMKKLAREKKSAITGSLIIEDENTVKNRAVWVYPDGNVRFYDKRHLFSMGAENQHFSPGNEKLILDYNGWKICILVCYDLRFPVWSRNTENYDVLIYMANWPAQRQHVWDNLLIARAIENQAYCVGVNRVGTDGAGINYVGRSAFVSPKGFPEYLGDNEEVRTFECDYNDLHHFRKQFPVLNDRDDFKLE